MSVAKKVANYLARKKKVNSSIKNSQFDHRLIVNRSNKYIYGHIVDKMGNTFVMMNDKDIKGATKTERAKLLWVEIAKKATEKWIKKVVFDRNGYIYHGRVAALCEGARESWLSI